MFADLQTVRQRHAAIDGGSGFTTNAALYGMGVDKTAAQNTAALQAAINAVQTLKGKVVIPAALGFYLMAAPGVVIGSDNTENTCFIEGESWNGVLGSVGSGGVNLVLDGGANCSLITFNKYAEHGGLRNLNLEGQSDLQTGITQAGSTRSYAVWFVDWDVDGTRHRAGTIEDCRMEGWASGGMRAGQQRSAGIIRGKVTILNCGRKESGTATGGAASTVTLAAGASAVDDFYNGMPIVINGGTGVGQVRTITDYVGSTKVATVGVAWEVQPVNGSSYKIGLVLADGIVFGSNNDWRVSGLDVGSCTRYGIYHTGAGSITYDGACNTFASWAGGLRIDSTALDMQWFGGSIDTNFGPGVWSIGDTNGEYSRVFIGVRFAGNGTGAHNTYADVKVQDDNNVSLIGCTHLKGSAANTNGRLPKHLVEMAGTTTRVEIQSIRYDRQLANQPWVTSRFSHEAMVEGLTESGTYTPTYTNVVNIAARTTFDLQYFRVGKHVQVFGRIIIDPTAAAPTQTIIGISLPIASNFANVHDAAGASECDSIASQGGVVKADTSNDRAELVFMAVSVNNASQYFNFSYVLL